MKDGTRYTPATYQHDDAIREMREGGKRVAAYIAEHRKANDRAEQPNEHVASFCAAHACGSA
eukprot:COSAG02_NODE_198_length_29564_cov_12.279009_11_plen_62_part_00